MVLEQQLLPIQLLYCHMHQSKGTPYLICVSLLHTVEHFLEFKADTEPFSTNFGALAQITII